MAKKIIPLKTKKSSPMKISFDSKTGYMTDFLGIPTGLGGKSDLEEQFAGLKSSLMGMDVSQNFYGDLANPYAGLEDKMASLENTAEDLTINQKAAEFQRRAMDRGLSQVLQQSKMTGTQNVQAIANQAVEASGKISASIGDQERQNQLLAAQQGSELQKLKAQSAQALEMQKAQGEFQVDMQIRKGREDALSRQLNKEQALLSLVSGEIARADELERREKGWLSKIFNIF